MINSKGMPFSCKVMRTFRAYGEGEAEISFNPISRFLHNTFEEKMNSLSGRKVKIDRVVL